MSGGLPCGIYDALLDTSLQDLLSRSPELRFVLGKLDPEEQPAKYADFVAKLVYQVLRRRLILQGGLRYAIISWPMC
jgi:hypothetical protein